MVIEMIHAFRSGDKAARLRKLTRFITTEDAPGWINALLESNQQDNVIIEVYARHAQDRYDDTCVHHKLRNRASIRQLHTHISGGMANGNLKVFDGIKGERV